jgi:uncharacterized protein DUF4157
MSSMYKAPTEHVADRTGASHAPASTGKHTLVEGLYGHAANLPEAAAGAPPVVGAAGAIQRKATAGAGPGALEPPARATLQQLFGRPTDPANGQRTDVARAALPDRGSPSSGGEPLPPETRTRMERAFGTDFSAVRVLRDRAAAAYGAVAFTQGDNIHIAPEHYDPGSERGRATLAHELTHVTQQRAGRVPASGAGSPVNSDAGLEAEADAFGRAAARDQAVGGAMPSATTAPGASAPVQCLGWRWNGQTWIWPHPGEPIGAPPPFPGTEIGLLPGQDFDPHGTMSGAITPQDVARMRESMRMDVDPPSQTATPMTSTHAAQGQARSQQPSQHPMPMPMPMPMLGGAYPGSGGSNDAMALSGEWSYNDTYWESTKGWSFYPGSTVHKKSDRLIDDKQRPVQDQTLIVELARREAERKKGKTGGVNFSLYGIPRGPTAGRDLDSAEGIAKNWSPGKSGDGYANAREHWEKHPQVGGRHHAATSFDEPALVAATASYVKHAYEFMATNQQNSFRQSNFSADGGSPKNVTVYYSSDCNTIAVFDQDMGVLRSFYDLNPSLHGAPSNREWLRANGARV